MSFFTKLFSKGKSDTNLEEPRLPKLWVEKKEIDFIRPDGYIIYKRNRVTPPERKQIGFYGLKVFSENGKYCVVYLQASNKTVVGNLALVDTVSDKILFKTNQVKRPHVCAVSNTGIVVCNDWVNWEGTHTYFWVFNSLGGVLIKKEFQQIVGRVCEVSDDGTRAVMDVYKDWEFYVFDLVTCEILMKVKKENTKSNVISINEKTIMQTFTDGSTKIINF